MDREPIPATKSSSQANRDERLSRKQLWEMNAKPTIGEGKKGGLDDVAVGMPECEANPRMKLSR